MGVRQHDLLPLAIAQKMLAKLLSCLGAAKPDTGPQLPMLLQWPIQSLKEEGLGVCRLPKNMRWKELFECDRPPCSSRGFVQISRNPFACCSKTPCSSRGCGRPCSSRRFGGDYWKNLQHFSGTVKCSQLGCLPGAKRLPDRETATNKAQDSHPHPAEQATARSSGEMRWSR